MNFSMVIYILGWILNLQAGFMMVPALTALIYGEKEGLCFVIIAAALLVIGIPCVLFKPKNRRMRAREGFVIVAFAWIILSLTGAIPYRVTGAVPTYVDALFETVSGYTTTGASVLADAGALNHCLDIWHCFTVWVGGMGILVFMLAVLPLTGGNSLHIMRAESPGPVVGKILPHMRDTAKALYMIYIGLTLTEMVVLRIVGLSIFDSICMSFSNAGTGGFGVLSDGTMGYTAVQQIVLTVFMYVFAINFSIYFLILTGRIKDALKNEELRVYLGIVLIAVLTITFNIKSQYNGSFGTALRHSAFQVATVTSTTGYASTDFNTWPLLSKTLLVILMFMGACAGSTCGGMKVSRYIIMTKNYFREMNSYVRPNRVHLVKMDGKRVDENTIRGVSNYFYAYILFFAASLILISIQNNTDLTTNFTAVTACLNNIGPGLGSVGPAASYIHLSNLQKVVLTVDMLTGRLELYPILVLGLPATWRKN